MSAIVATAITHRFGSEIALDSIDFGVDAGEHLAVLGENGAGKTTLLRILATATRPTHGTLEIFGVDAWAERRRLRARIGFVSHAPGLYPALSAKENLEFFCTLQGADPRRIATTLEMLGLSDVADRQAGRLSRGMQQRLAIARAVLHDPKLLVLDEPDASLDAEGPELLKAVMLGRTAVIATHDQALANRLCHRTLVLRRGRLVGVPSRLRVVH
jgi:heme ABC exporter ATP-binding subunit CcmA